MSLDEERKIFIKRKKIQEEGHHGGAWKVAYADFVTAMMAFFLLLWLLNATTTDQKQGISNYFEPIGALAGSTGSGGPFGGISATDPGPIPEPGQTSTPNVTKDTEDVKKKVKETKSGEPAKKTKSETDVSGTEADHDERQLQKAKAAVQKAMAQIKELQELAPSLIIEVLPKGLRIQLTDNDKRPLFTKGSKDLNSVGRELLKMISNVVKKLPNKIAITGHTARGEYEAGPPGESNWELSIGRANSARLNLKQNGISNSRILTIDGKADTNILDAGSPYSARNRRIAVLVLRKAKKTTQKELAPARIFKLPNY